MIDNVADVAFAGNETQLVAAAVPDVPLPSHICASTDIAVSGMVCALRLAVDWGAAERVIVIVIVDFGPEDDEPFTGAVTFGLNADGCEPPPQAAVMERASERPTQRSVFTEPLLRALRRR